MDIQIFLEMHFLGVSVLYGAGIYFFYDCFRCLRRTFHHGVFLVAVEDLIFWLVTAGVIFSLLYRYNSGAMRGYCILGMAVGMILYGYLISRLFIHGVVFLVLQVKKGFRIIFKWPLFYLRKIKCFLKMELKKFLETVKIAIKGK